MKLRHATPLILAFALVLSADLRAEKYTLVTGLDAGHWPGVARSVMPVPGAGIPGTFLDGDRLAGTSDVGPTITFVGIGTPLFQPNEFGAAGLFFHRGSVPIPFTGQMPLMGIDYVGGPRLDLDGDPTNGVRSLTPIAGQSPAFVNGQQSFIELRFDTDTGVVELINLDASGNNEGSPQVQAQVATVLLSLAGTAPDGTRGEAINPTVDTRVGTLTPFAGGGALAGVYHVDNLGYEFWYDSIDPTSGTAAELGTLQFLGTLRGWMVERDPATGEFPALAGQGIGSTQWPYVEDQYVGQTFATANDLSGGSATIAEGHPSDLYTAANNGGLALTDFGGDLGAYLDNVIVPTLPSGAARYIYLEGAGCGINNANDPVFFDTIAYDVVIVGADESCPGDTNRDGLIDLADLAELLGNYGKTSADPSYNSDVDFDGNGIVNLADLADLLGRYGAVCP